MKNQIAHIINVIEINETKKASYLHIAQPVTMRSMLTAKKQLAMLSMWTYTP